MSKTNDLLSDIADTLADIKDSLSGVVTAPAAQAAPAPAPAPARPTAPRTNGDAVKAALVEKINDYQNGRVHFASVEQAADTIIATVLGALGTGRRTAEGFLGQRA